jgi:hypothetical protein
VRDDLGGRRRESIRIFRRINLNRVLLSGKFGRAVIARVVVVLRA